MNKKWISKLACDIEAKYGKKESSKIFGNIDLIKSNPNYLSIWFDKFTSGMDKLNDKKYLRQMMIKNCPCGRGDLVNGKKMKEIYEKSYNIEDFVNSFYKYLHKKYNGDVDKMELHGNVLYMIKPLKISKNAGKCGKGCHCSLAKYTEKNVSDIFCYCCTIGHTGKMFKIAFGENIKIEFIESIICGGKECKMAIYLPEKKV